MVLQKADDFARELPKLALDNGVEQGHTEVVTKVSEMNPYTAISLRNQKQSPLLHLPAELRSNIYGYVFCELCIVPHFCDWNQVLSITCKERSIHPLLQETVVHPVSLLLVCRQIHIEAALLPFQLSEFRMCTRFTDISFHYLLGALTDEQRTALRHVSGDYCLLHSIFATNRELQENQHGYYKASLPLENLPGLRLVTFEARRSIEYIDHGFDQEYLLKIITRLGAHVGVDVAVEWID